MTEEKDIKFLQNGVKYIYNPDAPRMYKHFSNERWVETNTNHMEWLFGEYNTKLNKLKYSMILKINDEIKYISSDYNSVIDYIREISNEFKNDVHKIVCIKYNFDEY
jgi:hypothetical protein